MNWSKHILDFICNLHSSSILRCTPPPHFNSSVLKMFLLVSGVLQWLVARWSLSCSYCMNGHQLDHCVYVVVILIDLYAVFTTHAKFNWYLKYLPWIILWRDDETLRCYKCRVAVAPGCKFNVSETTTVIVFSFLSMEWPSVWWDLGREGNYR